MSFAALWLLVLDRIIDRLGPFLTLAPARKKYGPDTVLIVDGTLVPTHDHTVAASSKNDRYSVNMQVVINAETRLVVAVGQPQPGNRNDCVAYSASKIDRVATEPPSWPTAATKAPACSSRTAAAPTKPG